MSKKFKYKTLKSNSTNHYDYELNKLGTDGWELVSVTNWTQGLGNGCCAYFKKEVKTE